MSTYQAISLAAFLASPQSFAFVFAPLAEGNQPVIYNQGSLLVLTLQHLRTVCLATIASTVLAVALGIFVTRPSGALEVAGINAKVGLALAGGVVRSAVQKSPEDPTPGTERVGRDGLVPTGRTRTEDGTCAVVGVCTHLGGILEWNDAEGSWDCPLHGSRFAPDDSVLEGPATRPLPRRDG